MRSKDNDHKLNHREYNKNIYSERPKHIHQDKVFNPTLKSDFIVSFPSYDNTSILNHTLLLMMTS